MHHCIGEEPTHQLQMAKVKTLCHARCRRIAERQRSLAVRFVKQRICVGGVGCQHHKPPGLEHAAHLRQRCRLIRNMVQHVVGHHPLHARIGQRQRLCISLKSCHWKALLSSLALGCLHHAVGAVQCNHPTTGSMKAAVIGAWPTADVEHRQARTQVEMCQRPIKKIIRAFAELFVCFLANTQLVRCAILIGEIARVDSELRHGRILKWYLPERHLLGPNSMRQYNHTMPRREAHWKIAPAAPDAFLNATPEHPILAQALYNRGLRTPAEVSAFLNGAHVALENPYKLRDMPKAVQRILRALEKQETICVYGDFDVDGVASTALLVTALQALGGRVGPYIPDRVDEGYGLNRDAILRIAGQAQLLITVDCGIRSIGEVVCAVEHGLDVIVTDHHSVGKDLPPALAVINPRRSDCPTSFKRLAGVGVAFRLAQAVLRAAAHERWSPLSPDQVPDVEASLLDLVALGTVADMMPLLDENRSLVRRGLEILNTAPRPGLEALMLQTGLRKGMIDATAISFRLAPRLNAAGRLGDARLAYRLLRIRDPNEAYQLADALNVLNERRRALTEAAQVEAEQQLAERMAHDPPILIVSSEAFEHGIVGLVAGRLTERYYRPAVVMRRDAEEVRGSARSIPEFDVSQALDEVAHLLMRHGGHQLAAGFTARRSHEAALREALESLAATRLADPSLLRPTLYIDAVTPLSQITWGLAGQLARLEPTGQDNPPPILMTPSVRVREVRTVGGDKHLRLVIDDGNNGVVYDAIAFHQGEWARQLGEGSRIDIAFQLEVNEWQGNQRLQLNIQDLRAGSSSDM